MKYRVWARSISDVYLDVDADSPEEAKEIAEETDGSEFTPTPYGDWVYATVEEIKNEDNR